MATTTAVGQKSDNLQAAILFERIKAGDKEAFTQLHAQHHERVLGCVKRFIPEPDIAEYIANGVFIVVWRVRNQKSGWKGDSAFTTWLTRIAYNEALIHLRKHKYERTHNAYSLDASHMSDTGESSAPEFPTRDLRLEGVFDRQILDSALSKLPPMYRRIVRLRLIEGMNIQETCRKLKIKKNAVKSRLFRSRKLLRAILREQTHRPLKSVV